jgi:hypothetical protein
MSIPVHTRTAAVHPEWLPTWLPARALAGVVQQRQGLPQRPTTVADISLAAQTAGSACGLDP